MILKHKVYVTTKDIPSFYGGTIPKGTELYPAYSVDNHPIKHRGQYMWRFVFDTKKGSTAHNSPAGNLRVASFCNKDQKFDEAIEPLVEEEFKPTFLNH